MFFNNSEVVVTNGRAIILDEPLSGENRYELEKLETLDGQELVFLEDQQLAKNLEGILESVVGTNTLLVFPGNGSNYPRKLSRICQEFPNTAGVNASRFWIPGSDPLVTAGLIQPEVFLNLQIKKIVVVDDVVSSGLTMKKLHEKNSWRFPRAEWIAVAWLSQLPRGKFVGRGYKEVRVSSLVRREKGNQRVAINSISTLRIYPSMAASYAQRHFKDFEAFISLIKK